MLIKFYILLLIKPKVYFKIFYFHKNNLNFMPKLKTRKAASKRYKITGNDNYLRRHAFKGHLLMKKSNRQKRKLSQVICVNARDTNAIKLMLPY
jgi:large subunit ribosomal protein L35